MDTLSTRRFEKIPNYSVWNLVKHIQTSLNLSVTFTKVKSHTGDVLNDIADSLAKQGCRSPSLTPSLVNCKSRALFFKYFDIPIEGSVRNFYKEFFSAQTFDRFLNLNRNSDLKDMTRNSSIDWITIWSLFSLDTPALSTSFAFARLKTFIVKNFINELPTLTRMKQLHPDLYAGWYCIGCHVENETPLHFWTCDAFSSKMNNIISDTKVLAGDLIRKNGDTHTLSLLSNFFDLFDEIFITPSRYDDGYYNIIRSRIPSRMVSLIHQIVRSKHLAISITVKICLFFFEKIYDNVWKPRCNLMIEKERSEGISKKDKRLRGASKFVNHQPAPDASHTWELWIHLANKHGNKFSDF
jgi:hypothetical protein